MREDVLHIQRVQRAMWFSLAHPFAKDDCHLIGLAQPRNQFGLCIVAKNIHYISGSQQPYSLQDVNMHSTIISIPRRPQACKISWFSKIAECRTKGRSALLLLYNLSVDGSLCILRLVHSHLSLDDRACHRSAWGPLVIQGWTSVI